MSRYAVDGYFFTQQVSGIQRYAIELLAELDKLLDPGELELVVPPDTHTPDYANITVVPYENAVLAGRGTSWEQQDFPRYLAKSGRRWLCLCNVIPLWSSGSEGIAVLHDVCYKARPDFFTDLRGRMSAAWHCTQYNAIAAKAKRIVTVSEFSKSEIMRYYHVAPDRITVIYNAWQHMERVFPDPMVFGEHTKWPRLKPGEYYFSMSNLMKNKNFPWVLRAAQRKPEAVFAIAGGGSLTEEAEALGLDHLPNVVYLGYVTDGEAKTLMKHCKAFVFPTLYEGFGIPPLEAIACGAPRVMVSDTPCMREIYGEHADYIDLKTNDGNVDDFTPGRDAAAVLQRYSWAESARRMLTLLREDTL
ncbi:MAG: glycosyltransferase family 1 protein [Gemmiger sp.]|uniref:glycosyltransferase family 4 protein n=1 Tax=Gemmiger sp. TaxID=2049027 RepID=UPI002E77C89A|nr:glycosyltransferase family 1 protein [Gemmiger sp.]MEE0801402.1 glycosyltransferase family 1 protein [Gemmiger sp.]